MMRIFSIFVLLFCIAVYSDTLTGLVVGVSDGDTVKVLDATKTQHRIRLYGIDAPESHQAFGQRSKQLMSSLVFNKNVRVEYTEKDQYGRLLGTVYLGSININLEMVKAGLAWHYVYFAKNAKDIAQAEAGAREKKLGLWADPNPTPPWDFRRMTKKNRNK